MDKNIGKKLDGRYEITELIGVGGMAEVTRPMSCRLKAQDRNGNWFERDFTELGAQCTCHENDHLDGHIFTEIVEEFFVPEETKQ